MPDSLLDIRDDVVAVTDGVTAATGNVTAALLTGTATHAQLGSLRAALTGYRADIDAIRADLDATDVEDFLLYDDGAVLIRLWAWERAVRNALIVLAPKVRAAETVAVRLVAGSTREVYVSKSGDTLQSIAAKFLGNWREWPKIADANGITAGALASGTRLVIPPKK